MTNEVNAINIKALKLGKYEQLNGKDLKKEQTDDIKLDDLKDGWSEKELSAADGCGTDGKKDGFVTEAEYNAYIKSKGGTVQDVGSFSTLLGKSNERLKQQNTTITGTVDNYTISQQNNTKNLETTKRVGTGNNETIYVRYGGSKKATTEAVANTAGNTEVLVDKGSKRVRSVQSTNPKIDISGISYLYSHINTTRFDQITINGQTYKGDNLSRKGDVVTVKDAKGNTVAQVTIGSDRHITNIALDFKDGKAQTQVTLDKTGKLKNVVDTKKETEINNLLSNMESKSNKVMSDLMNKFNDVIPQLLSKANSAGVSLSENDFTELISISNEILSGGANVNTALDKYANKITDILSKLNDIYKKDPTVKDIEGNLLTDFTDAVGLNYAMNTTLGTLYDELAKTSDFVARDSINAEIEAKAKEFSADLDKLDKRINTNQSISSVSKLNSDNVETRKSEFNNMLKAYQNAFATGDAKTAQLPDDLFETLSASLPKTGSSTLSIKEFINKNYPNASDAVKSAITQTFEGMNEISGTIRGWDISKNMISYELLKDNNIELNKENLNKAQNSINWKTNFAGVEKAFKNNFGISKDYTHNLISSLGKNWMSEQTQFANKFIDTSSISAVDKFENWTNSVNGAQTLQYIELGNDEKEFIANLTEFATDYVNQFGNKDGNISLSEFSKYIGLEADDAKAVFDLIDTDKKGGITAAEFATYLMAVDRMDGIADGKMDIDNYNDSAFAAVYSGDKYEETAEHEIAVQYLDVLKGHMDRFSSYFTPQAAATTKANSPDLTKLSTEDAGNIIKSSYNSVGEILDLMGGKTLDSGIKKVVIEKLSTDLQKNEISESKTKSYVSDTLTKYAATKGITLSSNDQTKITEMLNEFNGMYGSNSSLSLFDFGSSVFAHSILNATGSKNVTTANMKAVLKAVSGKLWGSQTDPSKLADDIISALNKQGVKGWSKDSIISMIKYVMPMDTQGGTTKIAGRDIKGLGLEATQAYINNATTVNDTAKAQTTTAKKTTAAPAAVNTTAAKTTASTTNTTSAAKTNAAATQTVTPFYINPSVNKTTQVSMFNYNNTEKIESYYTKLNNYAQERIDEYDTDSDGKMSKAEFKSYMQKFGIEFDDSAMTKLFESLSTLKWGQKDTLGKRELATLLFMADLKLDDYLAKKQGAGSTIGDYIDGKFIFAEMQTVATALAQGNGTMLQECKDFYRTELLDL